MARGPSPVAEDATDHVRFCEIDGPAAPDGLPIGVGFAYHVITVGVAAVGRALFDTAAQAAMGLLGEILREQGIHRALEADMEVRNLALGEGDDPHAGIVHALEDASDIFLVAGEAIHRLGQHDLEPSTLCIRDQRLDAGSHQRCSRNGVVSILLDDGPALFFRVGATDAKLVGDREASRWLSEE